MTAKEAYVIVTSELSELEAVDCYEYNTLFVFKMLAKNRNYSDDELVLNCAYSVNKSNGMVAVFHPFHISSEELSNGKRVTDFE